MLTTDQKEAILRRAGLAVPDFPSGPAQTKARNRNERAHAPRRAGEDRLADPRGQAIRQWAAAIETLYVEYVAARAAKSLRDAEEARQLSLLRQAGERLRA